MNIVRVQVSEFPNKCDNIMLETDMLPPRPFGPPPEPGIDVVRFYADVAKGEGIDFVKKVLAKQLGLKGFDVYRVDEKHQSSRETVKLRGSPVRRKSGRKK